MTDILAHLRPAEDRAPLPGGRDKRSRKHDKVRADLADLPSSELERLQLMLSQDLAVLARVAADWAVHVNFEVSRGELPFSLRDTAADDELRRQVTGGLSIKF